MSVVAVRGVGFDPLRDKSYQSTGLGKPIVDHLARKENQGRRPRTLDDKERYLASLALTFPDKTLGDLTVFDIDHWIALQPAASRRHRASHVNTFLKWAVRWELVDKNPMDKLDPISGPKRKDYDVFTEAEIAALTSLPIEDSALMQILFDEGLRQGEARRLKLKHFRSIATLDRPHGEFVIIDGKGGGDRTVGASSSAEQKVNELATLHGLNPEDHLWYTTKVNPHWGIRVKRAKAMGNTSFQHWWRRCLDEVGVRYRNPHTTRHTFATLWLRKGGRLETLSTEMGHSSIQITFDLYAHLDKRDVAQDRALIEAN